MNQKIINTIEQKKLNLYKDEFSANGVVRIDNFLTTDFISNLTLEAHAEVFLTAFYAEGANREASEKDINNLPSQTKDALYSEIYTQAAKGFGFHYGRSKIIPSNLKQLFANQFLTFLNQAPFLDIISHITLLQNLKSADGQLTQYKSGDFLTRHKDNISGETREIAYVLSLSQDWHPDWGGLLQFFHNDGTPELTLAPLFNNIVLFDVNKIHSVTNVVPFSPIKRHSITGWIRS